MAEKSLRSKNEEDDKADVGIQIYVKPWKYKPSPWKKLEEQQAKEEEQRKKSLEERKAGRYSQFERDRDIQAYLEYLKLREASNARKFNWGECLYDVLCCCRKKPADAYTEYQKWPKPQDYNNLAWQKAIEAAVKKREQEALKALEEKRKQEALETSEQTGKPCDVSICVCDKREAGELPDAERESRLSRVADPGETGDMTAPIPPGQSGSVAAFAAPDTAEEQAPGGKPGEGAPEELEKAKSDREYVCLISECACTIEDPVTAAAEEIPLRALLSSFQDICTCAPLVEDEKIKEKRIKAAKLLKDVLQKLPYNTERSGSDATQRNNRRKSRRPTDERKSRSADLSGGDSSSPHMSYSFSPRPYETKGDDPSRRRKQNPSKYVDHMDLCICPESSDEKVQKNASSLDSAAKNDMTGHKRPKNKDSEDLRSSPISSDGERNSKKLSEGSVETQDKGDPRKSSSQNITTDKDSCICSTSSDDRGRRSTVGQRCSNGSNVLSTDLMENDDFVPKHSKYQEAGKDTCLCPTPSDDHDRRDALIKEYQRLMEKEYSIKKNIRDRRGRKKSCS